MSAREELCADGFHTTMCGRCGACAEEVCGVCSRCTTEDCANSCRCQRTEGGGVA
jgi:hypothetical protein